jgi:hypothetical protein
VRQCRGRRDWALAETGGGVAEITNRRIEDGDQPRPLSMNRDPVRSNAHIFRVHARRLSNPTEKDIFVASATKLAGFLDNRRAYYEEAQLPVRL